MILMVLKFLTMALQRPDTSSLSSSSLQRWQVAPLCDGKYKVVNYSNYKFMLFTCLFTFPLLMHFI